jgi:hypothetical protein
MALTVQVSTSVWVSMFVADERGGYGHDAIAAIFRTLFTTLPDVDHAFVLSPLSVGMFSPLDSGGAFSLCPVRNRCA